jgi:hypothetical protein
MPANVTTTAPTFQIIGDGEPSDAALAALARLLLAVVDAEAEGTTPLNDNRRAGRIGGDCQNLNEVQDARYQIAD